jgi:hypothetical protein
VVDALEGGAANLLGSVSAPAIYAYVKAALGAWDQRPLFKADVSNVVELRCSTPPIERALLRPGPGLRVWGLGSRTAIFDISLDCALEKEALNSSAYLSNKVS